MQAMVRHFVFDIFAVCRAIIKSYLKTKWGGRGVWKVVSVQSKLNIRITHIMKTSVKICT